MRHADWTRLGGYRIQTLPLSDQQQGRVGGRAAGHLESQSTGMRFSRLVQLSRHLIGRPLQAGRHRVSPPPPVLDGRVVQLRRLLAVFGEALSSGTEPDGMARLDRSRSCARQRTTRNHFLTSMELREASGLSVLVVGALR